MSTVAEIKDAILHLSDKDQEEVAHWLQELREDCEDILLPAGLRQETLDILDEP